MEVARYPLEILQKEMWERIILEVKESEDIRSLMKTSKQLNEIFMSIHHFWLLDKVLPFLVSSDESLFIKSKCYLEIKDLKNLRLVDKRWYGAVNTFLENRPHLRPYNNSDDKVNSEEHVWAEINHLPGNPRGFGRLSYSVARIDEFRANFDNLNKNPFPSRSINECAHAVAVWDLDRQDIPIERHDYVIDKWWFLNEMYRSVFVKFGEHIWFLRMTWVKSQYMSDDDDLELYYDYDGYPWSPRYIWEWIVNSLSSLPNLKSLNLEIPNFDLEHVDDAEAKDILQTEEYQLPPLEFLESLRITKCNLHPHPDLFAQQLVSAYSMQLRRLHISAFNWETCGKWTFPYLTEFFLEDVTGNVKVTVILTNLNAPQLAKLKFTSSHNCNIKLRMEKDIFRWIGLFPSLLYLDISDCDFSIRESGTLQPSKDSKPSLKYLKIFNSRGVNYNFLRCLPNLERLQIRTFEEPVVWDCSVYPEVRIKLEIETSSLYQSNVWEVCPKLRTLSCVAYSSEFEEFDRATYEKVKDRPTVERDLSKFKLDFLHYNKNEVDEFDDENESDDSEYFDEFYEKVYDYYEKYDRLYY